MKVLSCLLFVLVLSSCSIPKLTQELTVSSYLPDLGAAPELESDTWINVESPIMLADLRGKVILLDMWTYG
jgi:hypothetical protein